MSKLPVTKTFDGKYWLLYDEEDIKKACLIDCKPEQIEECLELMKKLECDCITCYLNLCNEIKVLPDQKILKRNCLYCKHLKVRYTGTGLLYLCNGIVLADEDEEFRPKNNCKKFELKKII